MKLAFRALENSVNDIIEMFYIEYFHEEWEELYNDNWRLIWDFDHWLWVVEINDYFWQFDDIRIALTNNIDAKTLFDWHDYSLSYHMSDKEWNPVNLIHYNRMWTKPHTYTNKEIIESQKKVEQTKKELEDIIQENRKN